MRRLAREIKVTPANFYNYYASLNEFLLEIAADHFDAFREQTVHIARTSADRTEALKRAIFHFVDFARCHPQLHRLMFGYISDAFSHSRYRLAAGAAFEALMTLMYGYRVFTITDDFGPEDMAALGGRVQVGYGMYAMLCGLSNLFVGSTGNGPFAGSDNAREDIAAFVNSIVDAFLNGDLPRVLGSEP